MSLGGYAVLLGWTLGFTLAAVPLGAWAVDAAESLTVRAGHGEREPATPSAIRLGLVVLVGFGVEAYIGVVLGLAHAFYKGVLLAFGAVVLVAGSTRLRSYGGWAWSRRAMLAETARSPLRLAGLAFAGWLVVSNYVAALVPPTLPDELSYHVPQSEIVARTHDLPLTLGGHYFYGNLPKIGEVLWAEGISVSGDLSLPRVVQMTLFLAFVVFVAAWVREMLGGGAALLAACLVLYVDQLTQYAPTEYVDTASACFEVAALLALAAWAQTRRPAWAARAALLLGLALSVKYSPLPTALYLVGLLLVGVFGLRIVGARRAWFLASVVGIAVVAAGFWYVKNLIRFGNPFYPLYLGHRGVTDQEYTELVAAIQQFGPRNLHSFVRVPLREATLSGLPIFVGYYVFPLALFIQRARVALAVLVVYVLLYTPYWFFLATHQLRFLAPAETVVVILVAGVATQAQPVALRAVAVGFAVLAIAIGAPHIVGGPGNVKFTLAQKSRSAYWSYGVGVQSRKAYLEQLFGCEYGAVEYAQQHLTGAVIDNWTQWHDSVLSIYIDRVPFQNFAPAPGEPLKTQLRRGELRYVYVRQGMKDKFGAETKQQPATIEAAYYEQRYGPEQRILRDSRMIWREDDCRIYKINGV